MYRDRTVDKSIYALVHTSFISIIGYTVAIYSD